MLRTIFSFKALRDLECHIDDVPVRQEDDLIALSAWYKRITIIMDALLVETSNDASFVIAVRNAKLGDKEMETIRAYIRQFIGFIEDFLEIDQDDKIPALATAVMNYYYTTVPDVHRALQIVEDYFMDMNEADDA